MLPGRKITVILIFVSYSNAGFIRGVKTLTYRTGSIHLLWKYDVAI